MPRPERLIGAAIATVLVLALLVLLFGPARGLRNDIGAQRELIAAQLATLQAQLDVVTLQLEETRTTRELAEQNFTEVTRTRQLTEEGLAEAQRTREVAEQTLAAVERLEGRVPDAELRELVAVARQTLQQAREINRKTGPSRPALP